jgi:hypothetical protein
MAVSKPVLSSVEGGKRRGGSCFETPGSRFAGPGLRLPLLRTNGGGSCFETLALLSTNGGDSCFETLALLSTNV